MSAPPDVCSQLQLITSNCGQSQPGRYHIPFKESPPLLEGLPTCQWHFGRQSCPPTCPPKRSVGGSRTSDEGRDLCEAREFLLQVPASPLDHQPSPPFLKEGAGEVRPGTIPLTFCYFPISSNSYPRVFPFSIAGIPFVIHAGAGWPIRK